MNKDIGRITASKMSFMRATARYTQWDHEQNDDIIKQLHYAVY